MTNTLNDFTKDCEIKCLKHIQWTIDFFIY